jgi:phage tail-like protein
MAVDQQTAGEFSKYLEYLPGILREDPFLGRFLLAFELIMSGVASSDYQKLMRCESLVRWNDKAESFPLKHYPVVTDSEKFDVKVNNIAAEKTNIELQNDFPDSGMASLVFKKAPAGVKEGDEITVSYLLSVPVPPSLEQYIDSVHTYFDPNPDENLFIDANRDFLPWLAGWVALSLRDDWDESTKRQFIAGMVPLYRQRGTKAGLKKILGLYLKSLGFSENVEVFEFEQRPYYFQVQLDLGYFSPALYWQQVRIAQDIIDREKPAHTYYGLKIRVPTMRIPIPSLGQELKIFEGVDEKGEPHDGNTALGTLKGATPSRKD